MVTYFQIAEGLRLSLSKREDKGCFLLNLHVPESTGSTHAIKDHFDQEMPTWFIHSKNERELSQISFDVRLIRQVDGEKS
jgi:hypothetical protein